MILKKATVRIRIFALWTFKVPELKALSQGWNVFWLPQLLELFLQFKGKFNFLRLYEKDIETIFTFSGSSTGPVNETVQIITRTLDYNFDIVYI